MSVGRTKRQRRAIMSVLRPLSGDRADGPVTAAASAGQDTIVVPKNCYLQPIIVSAAGKGELAHQQVYRTTAETTVAEGGTSLPIASLVGGARQNLAAGTVLRWDPPLLGLEPTVTVDAGAGVTGGANPVDGPGVVRSIVPFETLTQAQGEALFAARLGPVPALVVAWAGTPSTERAGGGAHQRTDTWKIYVVVANNAPAIARTDQALDILDAIEEYLLDRSSFDQAVFSAPGIEITDRKLMRATSSSSVYVMTFRTTIGVRRRETRSIERGDYATWLTTQHDLTTATPVPLAVVTGAIYPQEAPAGDPPVVPLSTQLLALGTMDSLHWAEDGFSPEQWDDLSGNDNQVPQAVAGKQPAVVADAINGKPAVRFDGVDDFMVGSWARPQPYTILVVCVPTRTGRAFVSVLDGTNAWILLDTWDAANIRVLLGGASVTTPSTVTDAQLIEVVANGANGSLRVNDADAVPVAGSLAPGGLTLGARPNGASNWGDTDIALVAIYTSISASDLAAARTAINEHYGLYVE